MPLSNIHIIHEDAGVLVVNKPTLLLSVPGRAEDNRDCLVTRLQENGYPEARIVHRLDWETSGIIVLARDADSHRELSRQFHDRETEKAYTALCWGQPELENRRVGFNVKANASETLELYAKISLTAHLLGGAKEIPRPQIDKLLDLRENYYHVTGRHPGYQKYPSAEEQKEE